jgi:hypothetical protein
MEYSLLSVLRMMSNPFYTFVVGPILGWLCAVSIAIVAYLIHLEIRDIRRNRRMDAERERLGLRRA